MLRCFSLYNDISHAISEFDELKTCLTYSIFYLVHFPASVGYSFLGPKHFFFAIVVFIVLCILISTVSYIGIYRTVRRHQLQIHAQQHAVQSLKAEHYVNMAQSTETALKHVHILHLYDSLLLPSVY